MLFQPKATITQFWAANGYVVNAKRQTVLPRSFHSLTFRESGRVILGYEDELYVSETNCITFMPKGLMYTTEVAETSEMLTLHFTTLEDYPDLKPMVIHVSNTEKLHSLYHELIEQYRAFSEHSYGGMALVYRILEEIENELSPSAEKYIPSRVRKAKKYIDENFNDILSVAELAESAGVSEVFFRSEFKKYVGMSPIAYIKHVRIENAKLLLRSGYHSVSEVATRCGFDSVSYFSYEFKRITGVSPSEYIRTV